MSGAWIAAFLALWIVVLLLGLLVLGLLRRIGPVLERAESVALAAASPSIGLPAGATVPDFELSLPTGEPLTANELRGRPYVLLFVSSDCAPCEQLAAEVRAAENLGTGVGVIIVAEELRKHADFPEHAEITLAFQRGREVSDAFGTSATPHAFAIDSQGTIVATGFPNAVEQLRTLAHRAIRGGDAAGVSDRLAAFV